MKNNRIYLLEEYKRLASLIINECAILIDREEPQSNYGDMLKQHFGIASAESTQTKESELFALCKKFISDQNIQCAETVHQTDRVIENAYEFIEKICDIVGYANRE